MDKGNGIYVNGSANIETGEKVLSVQNNEGAGVYVTNAAEAGQTNRLNFNASDSSHYFRENIAGIVVGDSESSANKGNAEMYVSFDEDGDYKNLYSVLNDNYGIYVAKNAYMKTEDTNVYVEKNGKNAFFPENGSGMIVEGAFESVGKQLVINNNEYDGLLVRNGGNVTLKDVSVYAGNNANHDIAVQDGSTLNMSSSSGGNNLIFRWNFDALNEPLTDSTKSHLFVGNGSTVAIENMSILSRSSKETPTTGRGLEIIGGNMYITSDRENRTIIDLDTNNPDDNDVVGISVAASDTNQGQMTIYNGIVELSNFGGGAINVLDSDMTISSGLYIDVRNNNGNQKGDINITAQKFNAQMKIEHTGINAGDIVFDIKGSDQYSATLDLSNVGVASFAESNDVIVFKMNEGNTNVNDSIIYGKTSSGMGSAGVGALIDNTSTSTFNAANSKLIGSVIDNGNLTATLKNSTWHMINEANPVSTIDTLKITDSSIDFRPFVENADHNHHTLTIKNAFISDNTDIFMNVNLDEKNIGDKIIFADGAKMDGTANLHITNTAPLGSNGAFIRGDGIKVVDAQGNAITGANAFDLDGKKIDTGAYVQELFYQNMGTNDESWYLRTVTEEDGGGNKSTNGSFSNGKMALKTDLANSVTGMPVVALSVIKTINSELRNRLGELRSNNPRSKDGLWARGYYKSLEVDENIKNEMDIYGFEAGYDHLIVKDAHNRTYMGIMAGYAQLDNLKITQVNDHNGKGDGFVPSVGAYLTWVNKNGWYTDAVVRGFLTQMDITNYSAQGQAITHDADRMAVSGSFEFGRRSSVYQKGRSGFILEPKAQIAYTFMPSKDEKTNLGQKINYDATNSLVTRGAIMAAYRHVMRCGMVFEPYVQVGVAYEWLGKTDVEFDDVKFTSDVGGATFEGAIGLNARLSRGWHLYGDVNLEQGAVYKSWGGHLGLRYNF